MKLLGGRVMLDYDKKLDLEIMFMEMFENVRMMI